MLHDVHSLVLYHVTPAENVLSILETTIDPKYAKGKMPVIWMVSRHRIEWALIHTSVHHDTAIDSLAVCAVHVFGKDVYRFNRAGFYYSYMAHKVESATPAMFFLHSIGMGEVENE